MQVYNNNLTTSIWKNYTTNAANLRGSISLLANGIKSAPTSDQKDISLDQALRMKYRQIAATAGETETMINHLQTTDAWMQKAQTILGELSETLALPQQTDQSGESDIEQIQTSLEMMRAELTRIQQKNNGAIFLAEGESEPPQWLNLIGNAKLNPAEAESIADAAREGITDLHGKRATIGEEIRKMELSLIELRSQAANIRATENQIRDNEAAQTTAENAKGAILTQIGTAMLAQANTLPGSVMHLTTSDEG